MNNAYKIFKWVIRRIGFLYFLLFLWGIFWLDYRIIQTRINAQRINLMLPASVNLLIDPKRLIDSPNKDTLLQTYLDFYDYILENAPDLISVYGMLGGIYYYRNNLDMALKFFQIASTKNSTFITFHKNLGIIYLKKNNPATAVKHLRQAVNSDLTVSKLFITRSKPYTQILQLNSIDIGSIDQRLARHRKESKLLLAFSLLETKQYHEVQTISINSLSEDPLFLYYGGVASYFLKDLANAKKLLEHFLSIHKHDAEAFFHLALVYKELGDEQTARKLLAESQRTTINPDISIIPKDCRHINVEFF